MLTLNVTSSYYNTVTTRHLQHCCGVTLWHFLVSCIVELPLYSTLPGKTQRREWRKPCLQEALQVAANLPSPACSLCERPLTPEPCAPEPLALEINCRLFEFPTIPNYGRLCCFLITEINQMSTAMSIQRWYTGYRAADINCLLGKTQSREI